MKKNMKRKIISMVILFVICLFGLNNAYATDEVTKKLYQDITINSDGSITIKEAALLGGVYNGREREIEFKNSSATSFTGVYSNFTGNTDIYDGSEITDIKIYDISQKNFKTIDDLIKEEKVYKEVSSASKGKYGVYTLSEYSSGADFRIYCPSNKKKVFCMEYTIKDAVVVHEDVAELYWNVMGDNYREDIEDFQVIVHLPGEDNDLRVWTHGPLTGVNEILDLKTISFKDTNVKARNAETIRIMFNKDLVPDATKKSGINGREHILKYEQVMADSANAIREKEKLDNLNKIEDKFLQLEEDLDILDYKKLYNLIIKADESKKQEYFDRLETYKERVNEKWKEEIREDIEYVTEDNYYFLSEYRLNIIKDDIKNGFDEEAKQEFNIIVNNLEKVLLQKYAETRTDFNIFYFISLMIVTFLIFIKLVSIIKTRKTYSGIYYRDFPSDIEPYVLEYLMKKNITNLSFSATILNLIYKKVIKYEKVQYGKKEDIKLILNVENYVGTKTECVVLDVLFNLVGKDGSCELNRLKKYGSTEYKARCLIGRIDRFKKLAKKEAEEKEYFSSSKLYALQKVGIVLFWIYSLLMSFGIFYKLDNIGNLKNYYLIFVTAICFVYLRIILEGKPRTNIGKEEYSKWLAHKRFLKHFSKFDEKDLPAITLWDKYLVTATILGCADKVQNKLKMHIQNVDDGSYDLLSTSLNSSLIRTINKSINSSVSNSKSTITAANAASSSGSGSGGGSSGGGGGRRWWRRRRSFLKPQKNTTKLLEKCKNLVYNFDIS